MFIHKRGSGPYTVCHLGLNEHSLTDVSHEPVSETLPVLAVACTACWVKELTIKTKPIFKGMHRPPWETLSANTRGGYVMCNCGLTLQSQPSLRDHWQSGHFDEPVYES